MKYAVLIGDGMADRPVAMLAKRTPLEASRTTNMDWIAAQGAGGRALNIPKGMEPGSDVANLSALGYNPAQYYCGRAPFEAASQGIELAEDEVAFRCNLVTVFSDTMEDYSAGHIKSEESVQLMAFLNQELAQEGIKFYPGVSYRNLLIIKEHFLEDGRGKLTCIPPHDISGKKIKKYLPRGKGADKLKELMRRSAEILNRHEINKVKLDLKENPANMIWLWGYGKRPRIPSFQEKYGLRAGIISAVDLLKGIGKCLGMEVVNVPGATGYYDTDYSAKADYAIKTLAGLDLMYVHVEAPDEAGHNGDLRNKILAIERFDEKVVGPVLNWLREQGDYRILVLPDHPTPLKLRTHTADPVPFALCGKGIAVDQLTKFTEKEALKGSYGVLNGDTLMEVLTTK